MLQNPPRSLRDVAQTIEHALLHPTLTDAEILEGCAVAKQCGVATVCVKPYSVAPCKAALAGSNVIVCSVIGFPHGNNTTAIKVAETERAIQDGATEIDMVINIGKALGGDWDFVAGEIEQVNQACVAQAAILKVIFETDYLTDNHIIRLCQICSALTVAFVKTSTGFGYVKQTNGDYNYKGATEQVLTLMRRHSDPAVQLKAAGGIRSLDGLLQALACGATRVGANATVTILDEARQRGYQ